MSRVTSPKISIIIPVYNCEKFLKKCFSSIENQTFKDFEVIIIDDESIDGSLDIVKDFCLKNNNFYFYVQKHSGQGVARNLGLEKARGEYISFVDSDDYINSDFLEKLYFAMVNNNADISCCELKLYYPQYELRLPFPSKRIKEGVYEKKIMLRKIIEDVEINSFPVNKLFKRSIFLEHNCKFKNMYFEDMVLIPELFFYSNKVAVVSDALYNYSQHRESTRGSMNKKKTLDFINSLKYTRLFLEKHGCYEKLEREFKTRANKVKCVNIVNQFRECFVGGSFKGFISSLKFLNNSVTDIISAEKIDVMDEVYF